MMWEWDQCTFTLTLPGAPLKPCFGLSGIDREPELELNTPTMMYSHSSAQNANEWGTRPSARAVRYVSLAIPAGSRPFTIPENAR